MAGVNIGVWGPIRLGWLERDRSASLDIGSREPRYWFANLAGGGLQFRWLVRDIEF